MVSLYPSPYHYISSITLGILIFIAFGCKHRKATAIDLFPKHFKVKTPFMFNGRGIIINTYWGREKKHHVLCLDNHSPSWIKSSRIQYDESFTKSTNFSFKTSTADGSPISGDVGICDSLSFENISFMKVPFYVMQTIPNDNKNDDGVFGIDLMSKGIWMIDFRKNELTLASSIDSIKEKKDAEIFPATFNQQSITVSVEFGNNNSKTMAIDLGYNGSMLIPLNEFHILSSSKKIFTNLDRFSTPVSENLVSSLSILDTVKINDDWFYTIVTSNEKVNERLIGLEFFKKFDYVIFDFINESVYIPKKVW